MWKHIAAVIQWTSEGIHFYNLARSNNNIIEIRIVLNVV